jgi:GT2 family glycosyltransferase
MIIGIPILNRVDLLERCVRSIDYPVGALVIVNNGCIDALESKVAQWKAENANIGTWYVYQPGANIGVAGGWNVLLHHVFKPGGALIPYTSPHPVKETVGSILICGNDIAFAEGDLQIFDKTLEDFPEADFIFGNHSYSNFLVKRSGYDKVGTFDESIYSAYLEDGDSWSRIIRTGAKAIHAAGLRSHHEGSATINSDAQLKAKVQAMQAKNWEYYSRKWGCPKWSSGKETFQTPFNRGGPVNEWALSPERLSQPHYLKSSA